MKITSMIKESWNYAREGLAGKWSRWAILALFILIFPLCLGYLVRVLQGITPAPEPAEYTRLFVDGIMVFVIYIIYSIVINLILIIGVIFGMAGLLPLFLNWGYYNYTDFMLNSTFIISIVVFLFFFILSLIVCLIAYLGIVRFAKTGVIEEAFHIREILAIIRKIGWIRYIGALILLFIVCICTMIPFLIIGAVIYAVSLKESMGLIIAVLIIDILALVAMPFPTLMAGRFMSLLYNEGTE